jgi:hypothetical protein
MFIDIERTMQLISQGRSIDPADLNILRSDATSKLNQGWTVSEVVDFIRLTEEAGCPLDEDTSLRQMELIRQRVEARLAGT